MEKTTYVLAKIKAVKGHTKAKNNRLKYYMENASRIEAMPWEEIEKFNFESEVLAWHRILENYKKIMKFSITIN